MSVTIYSMGRALLGAVPIAAQRGSSILDPNPPTFPRGVDGNARRGPYARTLREPTGRLITYPDKTNFTAAILNGLIALTSGDLSAVSGGYSLHDGSRGETLQLMKLNRMTLSGSGKRGILRWELDFMGAGEPAAFSTAATLITDAPVAAWKVYRDSGIPAFLDWRLEWNFNLQTNEEIGTAVSQYGSEVNASEPVVRGSFTFDSSKVSSLVDEQDFSLIVQTDYAGTPSTVTFLANTPVWVRPADIELGGRPPRSIVAVPVEFARKADGTAEIAIS